VGDGPYHRGLERRGERSRCPEPKAPLPAHPERPLRDHGHSVGRGTHGLQIYMCGDRAVAEASRDGEPSRRDQPRRAGSGTTRSSYSGCRFTYASTKRQFGTMRRPRARGCRAPPERIAIQVRAVAWPDGPRCGGTRRCFHRGRGKRARRSRRDHDQSADAHSPSRARCRRQAHPLSGRQVVRTATHRIGRGVESSRPPLCPLYGGTRDTAADHEAGISGLTHRTIVPSTGS
jgi:hypothetical protein